MKKKLFFFAIVFLGASLHAQTSFYWERPEIFSPGQGNFPVTAFNNNFGIVVWQEPVRRPATGDGSINIAMALKLPGENWERKGIIGGPYAYSGSEPSILSAIIDEKGRILIAAAASATQTEIMISEDQGKSFHRHKEDTGSESSLAPRIAACSDGSYLLFVTRGGERSLSIYYSRSEDGYYWLPFRPFVTDSGMDLNFLPSHSSLGGMEYVVFQSLIGGLETAPAFQLFVKVSNDGAISWGPSRRFTSFRDTFMNTAAAPDSFDNQRPQLSVQDNSLYLVWERRYRTGAPQIYGARLDTNGALTGIAERINSVTAYCNNPIAFSFGGDTKIIWFDNRRGVNRIFLAQRAGVTWENTELSGSSGGEASFGRPVVDRDGVFVFWQNTSQGSARINLLSPDTSVDPVRIAAENFVPGRRTNGDRVRLSWNIPSDPSGIQGFSWSWSRDKNAEPDKTILIYNTSNQPQSREQIADEDGSWFFSVIAQDFAGNWSRPTQVEFIRDTTPPRAAIIVPPPMDEMAYLDSNTFQISWEAPPDPDIEGYSWDLEYLGAEGIPARIDYEQFNTAAEESYANRVLAAPRVRGKETSVSFANQDDGIWRFSVRAVDEAGNAGPVSVLYFRTDKYIPYTYITTVDAVQDQQGILNVRILGRGFTQGGNITRIILDSTGQPPYEREFYLARGDYTVVSDREIRGLKAGEIDAGIYRLGVEHPARGVYFTEPLVQVNVTGTVKFGDYSRAWLLSWLQRNDFKFSFNTGTFILISVVILCGIGIFISVRGIGETVAEAASLRLDAAALIAGELMPSEKKKRLVKIKKQGMGLRLKLASFTIALVFAVVIMLSVPLYRLMMRSRQETLFQGLWDRSVVLLEGLATNARTFLPSRDLGIFDLSLLPGQMNSIGEARYVTITGYNPETSIFDDQVWASNDPDILGKINTETLQEGISRITDVLSPGLQELADELNERARLVVGDILESVVALTEEGRALASDEASLGRLGDIDVQRRTLETRLVAHLSEIGRAIRSEPPFAPDDLVIPEDRRYIFYKPIMYRQGAEDIFFRGLVRLEVSIDSILDEIADARVTLIRTILLIALAAQGIGAAGALLLSSLIIRPIRQLVSHVEIIRDTEDKAKLGGVDIKIESHDELAILGDTINDMTHGLVKAAAAASDLSIGKEIQKKFIPLELDREGNKLSHGSKDTRNLSFFGYYEGAKGVSGDYFDYQDLDGRYYAVIKCDVAGKGIPAALIMIQVATMFLNYFKQWKPTETGMRIENVVYQINDFIETLGFKGRFAAFTLCLYDSQTGIVRFCNAGDNIIHLFDASEGKVKTLTLPESPATGVLPNFLVESRGGYQVQTLTIDHGDILLLYTDGIEEAKRKFRDAAFREILCEEGEKDTAHATHTVGQGDEEMGPDRVQDIINAVMNKQIYTLRKWHNGEGDKDLSFDFSSCEGSVEEVIKAMVSVEKMFRCYRDPKASGDNLVLVDKIVDGFLREHFLQYREYCSFTRENPGNDAYMYYTHVNEDEQYDDLTILGIKRK